MSRKIPKKSDVIKHKLIKINKIKAKNIKSLNINYNSGKSKNKSSIESNKNIRNKAKLITQKEKNKKFNIKRKSISNFIIFNDNEMNSLNYVEAKILDKRTYFQYYLSLLRTKHILFLLFANFEIIIQKQ